MKKLAILLATLALTSGAVNAASVTFSDVVGSSYTQFNGFEQLGYTTDFKDTYTEDGISVNQVNPGSGIWSKFEGMYGGAQHTGSFSWYPNGGDSGYTRIVEQNGADFSSVSIKTWNGFNSTSAYMNYELRNNGATVLAGNVLQSTAPTFISFLGGGYDEILLSGTYGSPNSVSSGAFQALAIDDIKVAAVPEPETYAMLLAGLGLMGVVARRRKTRLVA